MKTLAKKTLVSLREMNNLTIARLQTVTNNKERNELIADMRRIGTCITKMNEITTRGETNGEEQNTSTSTPEK